MISETGAHLLYLPVCSPEFNAIEMMWSVFKSFIRQFDDSPARKIQSIIQACLLLPIGLLNVATVPYNKRKDCIFCGRVRYV